MMFFLAKHDQTLVIAGGILFGLWFAYMVAIICYHVCYLPCLASPAAGVFDEAATTDIEAAYMDEDDDDNDDGTTNCFPSNFADTRAYIAASHHHHHEKWSSKPKFGIKG